MKIVETRKIDKMKVRGLCIEKNYYTCGDCEAYSHLLNDLCAWKLSMTKNRLLKVAEDILEHSDLEKISYGNSGEEVLLNIMFELANDCCVTVYKSSGRIIAK